MNQHTQSLNHCPIHNLRLVQSKTQYGIRHDCPILECTVCRWDGSTSTPADQETRTARRAAHAAFDPLWKSKRFTRTEAYRRLSRFLGLPVKQTHMGMMNIDQCQQVVAFCELVTIPV